MISTELVLVNPDLAIAWLERNTHNRTLRDSKVREFAADMQAGRWSFNGDSIRFGEDGVLLDGQHRLWAVIASGAPQQFLVVRGLPNATQVTMDQGVRRTPSDQLQVVDLDVDKSAAAAIRNYVRWQSGRLFGDARQAKVTTPEIVQWAQEHPAELDLLSRIGKYRVIPAPPSITLAVALKLHQINYEAAEDFFTRLATGANLDAASPILALRRRLERTKSDKLRISERDTIAFFVVAWNAFREGRSLTKLQRPNGTGWTAERFPEPH